MCRNVSHRGGRFQSVMEGIHIVAFGCSEEVIKCRIVGFGKLQTQLDTGRPIRCYKCVRGF